MQVCIDIQSTVARLAGVGRYTQRLIENLLPLRETDSLKLFFFDFKRRGLSFPCEGAEVASCKWLPGRAVQWSWKNLGAPPLDWFAGQADLYHFPNFIRPPLSRGRSIITIHDLAFMRHPETLESRNHRFLTSHIRRTVEQSDAILAVSEFTAREVREWLHVPADRVVAIRSGVERVRERPHDADVAAVKRMLQLERPYLLCLSTLEPRKNFPFLVEVFERLRDFDGDLVIAGARGWKYEPILERMRGSRRAARIRYLEYVHDELLPGLYAGAELFVFPSLYEGFGFTPLEAMARGTAVVSSAGGALPEVLGDAALVIPEFDADRWAAEIERLLGDPDRLRDLKAAGVARAASLSWEETARQTWALYRKFAP